MSDCPRPWWHPAQCPCVTAEHLEILERARREGRVPRRKIRPRRD